MFALRVSCLEAQLRVAKPRLWPLVVDWLPLVRLDSANLMDTPPGQPCAHRNSRRIEWARTTWSRSFSLSASSTKRVGRVEFEHRFRHGSAQITSQSTKLIRNATDVLASPACGTSRRSGRHCASRRYSSHARCRVPKNWQLSLARWPPRSTPADVRLPVHRSDESDRLRTRGVRGIDEQADHRSLRRGGRLRTVQAHVARHHRSLCRQGVPGPRGWLISPRNPGDRRTRPTRRRSRLPRATRRTGRIHVPRRP